MTQILLASLCVLLAIAAISDLRSYTIPNWLSIALLALFLLQMLVHPPGLAAIALHIAAAVPVFVLATMLFMRGAFGGGDVKLLSSLALWVGLVDLPRLLLVMALSGGVLAVIILVVRRLASTNGRIADRRVPYGVAIAAAGVDYCLRQSHFPFW